MSKNKGKIVACLDLGTTKMVCLIASIMDEKIKILGYGYKESKGIVASAISDMRLAQRSIINAISDAEKMAGFNINRVVVGLSGSQAVSQIREVNSKISSDMVRNSDIASLVNDIRLEYRKNNREVIHLIPLQYKIDDSNLVQNPRYMSGEKLSAKFHVVSASFTTAKNIEGCLKRCQLSVNNYIAEVYASAISSLTDGELNLGTLVIDIGSSNTSFAVMSDGKLVHTGNFPIGGIHITRDIATVLNIDFETAERIKNLNNSLIINPLEEKELIKLKVGGIGDEVDLIRVTKMELRSIIMCRLEEIVESVKKILDKTNYGPYLVSSIVLTGGCSSIIGIEKVVSDIFRKQVRIGYPGKIENLPPDLNDPSFCSSVGILVFLKNIYTREKIKDGFEVKSSWLKKFFDYITT